MATDSVHPDDLARALAKALHRANEDRILATAEAGRLRLKDGRRAVVDVVVWGEFDASGE